MIISDANLVINKSHETDINKFTQYTWWREIYGPYKKKFCGKLPSNLLIVFNNIYPREWKIIELKYE